MHTHRIKSGKLDGTLGCELLAQLLMALALILLSYWVWQDNVEIKRLQDFVDILRAHTSDLEKKKE